MYGLARIIAQNQKAVREGLAGTAVLVVSEHEPEAIVRTVDGVVVERLPSLTSACTKYRQAQKNGEVVILAGDEADHEARGCQPT